MSLAIVFPGQGSQSIGMLANLAADFPVVEETFAQASAALGYDLWALVQNGPEADLNATDKTQPAMLAAGIACWRVLQQQSGMTPKYLAGHSLGEYTALVASGALDFTDAIKLVEKRGQLMQSAVPVGEGAMAAILGLDDDKVISICAEMAAQEGGVLEAVNFNSPGQVVIAGSSALVAAATETFKEAGAKRAMVLPVSVPSHCALMQSAAEGLQASLETVSIKTPDIEVVHNVDVKSHPQAGDIKNALVQQLYKPVRWVETIQFMAGNAVETVIECGPGKVLAGLNKRIDKQMTALPVFDTDSLNKAIAQQNAATA